MLQTLEEDLSNKIVQLLKYSLYNYAIQTKSSII